MKTKASGPNAATKTQVLRLLQEADFGDEGGPVAEQLLGKLVVHRQALAPIEPPAGYEDRLLASLRTRVALERVRPMPARESVGSRLRALLRVPELSWSVAGALALFIAVFAYNTNRAVVEPVAPVTDMLASTAVRGGEGVVDSWIESVGDSGVRASSGERDLASLAAQLEKLGNDPAAEQALAEVASSLGYGARN